MDRPDLATRVARVAALADPVRRALYLFVVEQPEPVARDRAASELGLAHHTVKFNLDRLVEAGLLDVEFRRLNGRQGPGAGRPSKLYRRSEAEASLSLPDRTYDIAAALMAQAIEESERDGSSTRSALERAAAERGGALGSRAADEVGTRASSEARLGAALAELQDAGYEPRVRADAIVLANCPFHRLAAEHTDLVCGMNLTLLTSVLAAVGETGYRAELRPSAGSCCVTLTPQGSGP